MIRNIWLLIRKYCWGVGGLITLSFFTHAWGFCPDVPGFIIWALMLYCIANGFAHGKLNLLGIVFLCALPFGIFYFNPDPCFKSLLRYGNFVLLFLAIGPIFNNDFSIKIRRQALNTMLVLSIFTGVVSFFCFFLGINYMRMFDAQEMFRQQGGYFGGLCVHSMTLAPIAAIGATSLFYLYLKHKKKLYLAMLTCCIGTVLFAASRSALMAAFAGIIATSWYFSRRRSVVMKRIVMMAFFAIVTFPLWEGATDLVMSKQRANEEQGSMTSSRDSKFQYRIEEFNESPLFGVGFCAIDPKTGDDYSSSTGTIEPGTAWLQVPSMTGLVGTIPFIILLIGIWKNTSRRVLYTQRGLILGLMAVFFMHFFAEGYLFSAGNELCFMAWLVIASCGMPWYKNMSPNDKQFIVD